MRRYLLAGLVLLAVALGSYVLDRGARPLPQTGPAATEADFEEAGNLLSRNGATILLYEEPGAPALSLPLVFTDQSRCSKDGAPLPCSGFAEGQRARVKGKRISPGLKVAELELLAD